MTENVTENTENTESSLVLRAEGRESSSVSSNCGLSENVNQMFHGDLRLLMTPPEPGSAFLSRPAKSSVTFHLPDPRGETASAVHM